MSAKKLRKNAARGMAAHGGAQMPGVVNEAGLLADLRALINTARQRVAVAVSSTQTILNWHIGRRLLKDNLQDGRAAYGKRILAIVSRELTLEFGNGYSYSQITRMVRFAETFPDKAIVVSLLQQLSWGHILALLPLKDPLARDFYSEMDLLFYHRHLRRLVAIELKLESFQPAHVGQMEFYLRWLDRHERAPGEKAPIGLILCASADAEQEELCQLKDKPVRVSEYFTELPPMELLRTRLHQAIAHARATSTGEDGSADADC